MSDVQEPQQPPRLLPPRYLVKSVLFQCLTLLAPAEPVLPDLWRWAGLVPLVLGVGIAVRGSRQFARARTGIIPFSHASTLVTDGVFAWSRNPMYTGMLLTLTGIALLVNQIWAWAPLPVLFAILRWGFIAGEERQLQETFGAEYDAYRKRVRRWV